MSDIWLRRGNGYALLINPKLETSIKDVAHIGMHTPGGYQTFTVDRKLLVHFVEDLSAALTEPTTNSVEIAYELVPDTHFRGWC